MAEATYQAGVKDYAHINIHSWPNRQSSEPSAARLGAVRPSRSRSGPVGLGGLVAVRLGSGAAGIALDPDDRPTTADRAARSVSTAART